MTIFVATGNTAMANPVATAQTPEELAAAKAALAESRERAAALAGEKSRLSYELARIRETLANNAILLQARENERLELIDRIGDLETRLSLAQARLTSRQEELSQLLGGLQRLGRIPPEAILSQAKSMGDVTRAATIMGNAVPALQDALDPLRREISSVRDLRLLIENRRVQLTALSERLQRQDAELATLLTDRAQRLEATAANHEAEAKRVEDLAKRAANLQTLMEQLERLPTPAAPEPPRRSRNTRISFISPVAGSISQEFGSVLETGGQADGLIYHARVGQMVLAPADGVVRYAGPFRRYGQVVIIDHGGDYHSVLAGPLNIMANVGQNLAAGEPVGRLDQTIAASNSLLNSVDSGSNTENLPLYFESRFRGRPQNPLSFVAERTN
ncbi:MAG: peptidoglycan DD-metalloendopeptidase family protein [Pseudomonadota bacterium]